MSSSVSFPVLKIVTLPHAHDIELPSYETAGAAGMDLRAAVTDRVILYPQQRILIPTGLIIEIPQGYEAQIRPRSGLALNAGITCLNTPGTIDADYRGEIKILLINLGDEQFVIERHMRIAQMIISPIIQAYIEKKEEESLSETARDTNGFGSTGLR